MPSNPHETETSLGDNNLSNTFIFRYNIIILSNTDHPAGGGKGGENSSLPLLSYAACDVA